MTAKKYPKPEPVVVRTICSLCDEDWDRHGDDPTTLDCIRLLKARPVPRYIYNQFDWTRPIGGVSQITYLQTQGSTSANIKVGTISGSTVTYKTPKTA